LTVCGSGAVENPADAAQNPQTGLIRQLVSDLAKAGFVSVPGGKGSHRKFRHARLPGSVILSGADGNDAHHYQEKQVRNAIREATK
jgi:predicted RNA binding protein YcfA (HicA-like mRNA interferase family)